MNDNEEKILFHYIMKEKLGFDVEDIPRNPPYSTPDFRIRKDGTAAVVEMKAFNIALSYFDDIGNVQWGIVPPPKGVYEKSHRAIKQIRASAKKSEFFLGAFVVITESLSGNGQIHHDKLRELEKILYGKAIVPSLNEGKMYRVNYVYKSPFLDSELDGIIGISWDGNTNLPEAFICGGAFLNNFSPRYKKFLASGIAKAFGENCYFPRNDELIIKDKTIPRKREEKTPEITDALSKLLGDECGTPAIIGTWPEPVNHVFKTKNS